MHFTDIFIRRPVLAIVVSLLILLLGLRAAFTLPILQYPRTETAVVTVSTSYYGAEANVVAGFITTPLENAIAQANGIDYLTSQSRDGSSTITANLRLNYDSNRAMTEISAKVSSVLNQLPAETERPVITLSTGDSVAAMYLGFSSDVLPPNAVTDYLVRVVQPRLQAVEGVQTAQILGGKQFALRAWLDPLKMAARDLTATDINQALARNNYIAGVGTTKGRMVQVSLAASTSLTSLEDFRRLIVSEGKSGVVRLEDVANVTLGSEDYETAVSFDGKQAVYVGIFVAPSANLIEVINGVHEIFPNIQASMPKGLDGMVVYDSTLVVKSSIKEVVTTLIEALLIVTGVIFIFLRAPRPVLIPALAIPLSLIGTFGLMAILGFSINLLTLLAMVLAIGLVVDDAIIVVENVTRHMHEGMSPLNASIVAARELAGPIIAMTVVLAAVYVPVGFQGGLTGSLFTEFAFTLVGAVTISGVVALTLSPMMCSRLLHANEENKGHWIERMILGCDALFEKIRAVRERMWLPLRWLFAVLTLPLTAILACIYYGRQERYEGLLRASLQHTPVTLVFSMLVLTGAYFMYTTSFTELAPPEDMGVLFAPSVPMPEATLQQRMIYSKEAYRALSSYPEVGHVFQIENPGQSFYGAVLTPWDERERSSAQVQDPLQKEMKTIPGINAGVFPPPPLPGNGGMPIQFVVTTLRPVAELAEATDALAAAAQKSGKFIFLNSDLKIDQPQTMLRIDRDKASQLGVSMSDVGTAMSALLGGGYVNYFAMDGRSYKVMPQVAQSYRLTPEQLDDYYIRTATGETVSVSTVVSRENRTVAESVNHFQQINSATISGVPLPGVTLGTALGIMQDIAKESLPSDYSVDYAGSSRQFMQETGGFAVTFGLALIIIFLTLSGLYESFRDPLIILVSVPMSLAGALLFINLGLGGMTINIYTQVGLVTLMGLISKHGILITEFANALREEGHSKLEAVVAATCTRLRPIVMTTAATVVGMIPLVIASGAGAASRFNIGLVIASGMTIGTLFTLFVVPAMYMLVSAEKREKLQEIEV